MTFLEAEWRKLAIANYEIDPQLLEKYLPANTELDLWQNTCYVSVVGFMFLNTRVLGWKIPFHINFEEVNLRFYVRHQYQGEWRRGVVFIKEIVPKPAISWVANTIYKEHYETKKMDYLWQENEKDRQVEYRWKTKNTWECIAVNAGQSLRPIEQGSEAEFITEHYWGYSKADEKRSFEYEVTHPRWQQYQVESHQIEIDFGTCYGLDFESLNRSEPKSVMLAEGSKITVKNKRRIE